MTGKFLKEIFRINKAQGLDDETEKLARYALICAMLGYLMY